MFFLLPTLWLASSGFQSEQPAKPRETRVPETAPKPPVKPAWKWTLQERLARRFNPEEMKTRADEQKAEQKALRKRMPGDESDPLWQIPGDSASTMLVEGRKTPELFLAWELFDALLDRGFSLEGEKYNLLTRRPIEERAAALGFGRDLWPRLEKVASPYLRLQAEEAARQLSGSKPHAGAEAKNQFKMSAGSLHLCRARAQALSDAKAEFGEEAFLRLLYEAVAPEVQFTYLSIDPEYDDQLRFIEGGCR
jgi:hypothetical protein